MPKKILLVRDFTIVANFEVATTAYGIRRVFASRQFSAKPAVCAESCIKPAIYAECDFYESCRIDCSAVAKFHNADWVCVLAITAIKPRRTSSTSVAFWALPTPYKHSQCAQCHK